MQATGKDTYYNDRSAIRHLKELHIQAQRDKYPSLPYYSTPDYSAAKTNGLTKCIMAFIKLKGHFVERTSNEGRMIDTRQTFTDTVGLTRTIGGVQRIKGSGTNGTSDLKACIDGRFIAIEIKCTATNDRIRPAQVQYKQAIEASGAVYVVATSLAQFINWYYSNY